MQIQLTKEANYELEDIIKYISQDNPEIARKYAQRMIQKLFNVLSIFPLSCPLYNTKKQIRVFHFEKYKIFYRFEEKNNTIYILHITHSRKPIHSL